MKIILIRHSNTVVEPEKYNPLWSLSEKGIDNAEKLANDPILNQIEVLYSSNQLKAINTGIIVASKLGVFLKQREDLTELTSLTNDWKEDYDGFVHDMYTGAIERHKDGESLDEARERFTKALEEIVAQEQSKKVIGVVAHANVLSLFSEQYEDRIAFEIHEAIQMPDVALFDWEAKEFELTFGNYGQEG